MKEFGWQSISFVKIDAEGAELNIIQGGIQFFEQLSPLVMFEVEHVGVDNVSVPDAFAKLGYSMFRLVPALGALVAADSVLHSAAENAPKDLNLFAAKADCVERLAARGLLIRVGGDELLTAEHRAAGMAALRELPHARALRGLWAAGGSRDKGVDDRQRRELEEVEEAVSTASFALLPGTPMGHENVPSLGLRYVALLDSYKQLDALCTQHPTPLRICSLQRVARGLYSRVGLVAGELQQMRNALMLVHAKEKAKFSRVITCNDK
jgi:hypothetical protein